MHVDPGRSASTPLLQEGHSFSLKPLALLVGTPKGETGGKTAVCENHAMARNIPLIGIAVKGETDKPGRMGRANHVGDLPIRCDFPARYLTDSRIDALIKRKGDAVAGIVLCGHCFRLEGCEPISAFLLLFAVLQCHRHTLSSPAKFYRGCPSSPSAPLWTRGASGTVVLVRQSEYDIIAKEWEYAESAARSNPLATDGLPHHVVLTLKRPDRSELAHPVSQMLFLRLLLRACKVRNTIFVCDNDPDTAAAAYATLLGIDATPGPQLTVVCQKGSSPTLRTLLSSMAQSSHIAADHKARFRIVEANPADYLTRLTPSSYDALIVSGGASNYTASLSAAPTLLHSTGILLLTDALASANNPTGGVVVKVDRSGKTVTMRSVLARLHKSSYFDSALLPIGTGIVMGLRR